MLVWIRRSKTPKLLIFHDPSVSWVGIVCETRWPFHTLQALIPLHLAGFYGRSAVWNQSISIPPLTCSVSPVT